MRTPHVFGKLILNLGYRCRNCLKKQIKSSPTFKCPICKKDLKESDFFRESQIENEVQRDKKYREEVLKEYIEDIR